MSALGRRARCPHARAPLRAHGTLLVVSPAVRNYSSAFKVGLLLLVALLGSGVLYRAIVLRASGSNGYRVYALFRDASGLVPRSRVTMAGIPIGTIESIRLQDGMARVELLLNRDVQLFEDATVSRRASSLLGEFQVVIAPGTQGARRVENGERVRVLQEGATTDDILNNVNAITVRVRSITDRLGDVFGTEEGRRQMAETLRNLQETTAEVNRLVHANSETITHALRNVDHITQTADPRVRQILDNLNDASRRVDHILEENQPGIRDTVGSVQDTMHNAREASRDLREALGHVNRITEGLDRGEGTVGRLLRDDHLINEVEGVAEGVNEFVGPLSRLQTIVGLRTEFNFVAGALKSYIELRLQPRENQYLLFQIVDDPRGRTDRTSTIITSTNPNEPHRWIRTEERTSSGFRFTVQLARRVGPTTLRFGIMESTGGIGADLHLFNDRFELRSDLFDFSANTLPRLRFALAFEVVQRAWILGGVDDVLNGPRTDYFLGAMLRFRDDDLRGLLLFAGGLLGGATR